MNNKIHIGLDAGGSKINVLGCYRGQRISAQFPSENARKESPDDTANRIFQSVEAIWSRFSEKDLDTGLRLCAGIAGASEPRLQSDIKTRVAHLLGIPTAHIRIVSDARVAFEAAFNVDQAEKLVSSQNVGPKLLVIAGTGSGCYSFTEKEEFVRTGGWGSILGDPGSGTALGLETIRHLLAAIELGQISLFESHILDALKPYWNSLSATDATYTTDATFDANDTGTPKKSFPSVAGVLGVVYNSEFKPSILAPLLLELCAQHDAAQHDAAQSIVDSETTRFAEQIKRLADILGKNHPTNETNVPVIALVGGLSQSQHYQKALSGAIQKVIPGANVTVPNNQPVDGALSLAEKME